MGPGAFSAHRRGRDTTLECSAIRLLDAIAALSKTPPGTKITYFEASPTKDDETYRRWQELNDAGKFLRELIADRKSSEADGGSEHAK